MRDPNRIEPMLDLLRKVWMQHPDMRLGQIIVNAARQDEPCPQIYSVEDGKVSRGLEHMLEWRHESSS